MSARDAAAVSPRDAVQRPAGKLLGPIAFTALGIAAFLLAVGGSLWIVAGEAVFRAMVEAGAGVLCL